MQGEIPRPRPEIPFEMPFLTGYPEWQNLIAADMAASVEAGGTAADPFVELKRTLCSLHALNAIKSHMSEDDPETSPEDFAYDFIDHGEQAYARFTAGQPPEIKLNSDAFDTLNNLEARILNTTAKYRRMQYFMLISDACKNPELMRAAQLDPASGNHDEALVRLFSPGLEAERARYFPSFDDPNIFSDEDRTELQQLIGLMRFNFPGWAQSQASTAHLELLPESTDPEIKMQFLLHGMLDVMGAAGHRNITSADAYTQPTHDMFMHAFTALTATPKEVVLPEGMLEFTPRLREALYTALRAKYFGVNPATDLRRAPDTHELMPDVDPAFLDSVYYTAALGELKGLIAIANMCRYRTPERFAQLRQACHDLSLLRVSELGTYLGKENFFDLDYGPSLVRSLIGAGDKARMQRGLELLNLLLQKLSSAGGADFLTAGWEDADRGTSPDLWYRPGVAVQLREIARQCKEPGFEPDIRLYTIAVERRGEVFIPRLQPRPADPWLDFGS